MTRVLNLWQPSSLLLLHVVGCNACNSPAPHALHASTKAALAPSAKAALAPRSLELIDDACLVLQHPRTIALTASSATGSAADSAPVPVFAPARRPPTPPSASGDGRLRSLPPPHPGSSRDDRQRSQPPLTGPYRGQAPPHMMGMEQASPDHMCATCRLAGGAQYEITGGLLHAISL